MKVADTTPRAIPGSAADADAVYWFYYLRFTEAALLRGQITCATISANIGASL
jgi:hypothetical protein